MGTEPRTRELVLLNVAGERRKQDGQWGGPEHDDEHRVSEWVAYILYQASRLLEIPTPGPVADLPELRQTMALHRERFVKIAALAVAAVESIDRIGVDITRHCDGA